MITKIYKAKSAVSIVVMCGKASRRITFDAMSDGTSTYKTSDETLQAAIERHHGFGRTFRLFRKVETKAAAAAAASEEAEEAASLTQVTVTDAQSARQYLIESFGVSKTSVRTLKQLMEQAAAHGIEFIGI